MTGPAEASTNPVVSLASWWTGRRRGEALDVREVAAYLPAQIIGAVGGAILANAIFARLVVRWSVHDRFAVHPWLGEVVATAGPIALIFALARIGRASQTPVAVASYIGAAYWFTSSTSFANPAVTIGRAFTDTFAGIAPGTDVRRRATPRRRACSGSGRRRVRRQGRVPDHPHPAPNRPPSRPMARRRPHRTPQP